MIHYNISRVYYIIVLDFWLPDALCRAKSIGRKHTSWFFCKENELLQQYTHFFLSMSGMSLLSAFSTITYEEGNT